MATTKRSKRGRAAATRARATAKPASSKSKKGSASRKATKLGAKPRKASPSSKSKAPTRATPPKSKAAKPGIVESPEVRALKAKFQRERKQLEKNLTEAVREIGLLRHHELRVTQLERQLADRDTTIGRLQSQLADLERRPAEPVYVHEVQQSLALGGSAHHLDTGPELDEFGDEPLADDAELLSDED